MNARPAANTSTTSTTRVGSHRTSDLVLRPLGREDGELLDQIMAGMSPQSRLQRFHVPKQRLSSQDRCRLTDVDDRDHVAVIALGQDGAPIGVARVIRLTSSPDTGEAAVTVVDRWQGLGLGTVLLSEVASRAGAVGICRLVAYVRNEGGLVTSMRRRGWRVIERVGQTTTLATDTGRVIRAA